MGCTSEKSAAARLRRAERERDAFRGRRGQGGGLDDDSGRDANARGGGETGGEGDETGERGLSGGGVGALGRRRRTRRRPRRGERRRRERWRKRLKP